MSTHQPKAKVFLVLRTCDCKTPWRACHCKPFRFHFSQNHQAQQGVDSRTGQFCKHLPQFRIGQLMYCLYLARAYARCPRPRCPRRPHPCLPSPTVPLFPTLAVPSLQPSLPPPVIIRGNPRSVTPCCGCPWFASGPPCQAAGKKAPPTPGWQLRKQSQYLVGVTSTNYQATQLCLLCCSGRCKKGGLSRTGKEHERKRKWKKGKKEKEKKKEATARVELAPYCSLQW